MVGAGYIGLELGTAFAKLGSKVTLVEAADRILPQYDDKLTRIIRRRMASFDIDLRLDTRVTGWSESSGLLSVETEEGPEQIAADKVLVAVGRVPNTHSLGLDELSLGTNRGFIEVDDCCRTRMRGVYAIGDVTPGPMLAHRAMAEAEVVADLVAGRANAWDRICVPEVCFTDPELVSVGLSQKAAQATGACAISEFSFRASGRAMTLDDADGFVRIIARESDHVILGMQAVGPGVSELSGEFSLAIEASLRAEDLASTIHAHPTLSEAIQEAALATSSMANHG